MTHDNKTASAANTVAPEAKDEKDDPSSDTCSKHSQQDQLDTTDDLNVYPEDQNKLELTSDPPSCTSDSSGSSFFDPDAKSSLSCSANNNFINRESEKKSHPNGFDLETSTSLEKSDDGESQPKPSTNEETTPICYNPVLDDEIRSRLDKLNALSDLINSLELQFDQANALFRDTLKCSTERLSTIAKNLGSKSIRQGRVYHAAKITVEQTQTDCQKACVQFERANNDHQYAKLAIKEAECNLLKMKSEVSEADVYCSEASLASSIESVDVGSLSLKTETRPESSKDSGNECDKQDIDSSETNKPTSLIDEAIRDGDRTMDATAARLMNSAQISEDLNRAIIKLVEAEEKRRQSEKMHLDHANKLMIAQENLIKLEREYGTSIRRAQVYFDEARRFNAKLNSVKSDIARISEDIVVAKRAYARTLNELEQFSEALHVNGRNLIESHPEKDQ